MSNFLKGIRILEDLTSVQKPGRYIGEEWNIVKKNWLRVEIKILISYPDIYEIGMSNLGLSILYELLNSREDILCERCFAPWRDMEAFLRENSLQLFSLESKTPINQFDLIGFTLQHELNYTNILTMLDLGGLKIWQPEREESHPLIVAGGPCTLNPEPVGDFFDFFIIGDAEEVIWTIIEEVKKWKQKKISRNKFLENVSKIDSVYVPSLYRLERTKEGFLTPIVERKIKKAIVRDLEKVIHPLKPVVPYIQTIHERINLEIMRGCPRNCRFCQARVYYGPPRVRKVKNLIQIAQLNYINTGYEEICLSSLSSGDYPYLLELLKELRGCFQDKYVFISLPSLWADEKINKLLEFFLETKRPALTFAPEVSSLRMKEIVGKFINEERISQIVNFALNKGWKTVKLYYMLGLPGLTQEDLIEVRRFLIKLLKLRTKRKPKFRLSFSTFIPKPHTPLQWIPFIAQQDLLEQIEFIKYDFPKFGTKIEIKEYQFSLLEALLSRGDRRLSNAIYEAWLSGARFDAWEQEFRFDLWYNAFVKSGLNYEVYLKPGWNEDSILPWEYIDTGIEKEVLVKGYNFVKSKI